MPVGGKLMNGAVLRWLAAIAAMAMLPGAGMAQAALREPSATLTLDAPWTDHAVIQRDRPVMVAGHAAPGAIIAVQLGDVGEQGRTDPSGRFTVTLPARPASAAPLALTVGDGSTQTTVSDILVGDVWLCSGQSNMEYPLADALDSHNAIAAAADPGLRLLTVPKDTASMPRTAMAAPAAWLVAAPATATGFSAACYHMGKRLRADTGVPVGLIHASWGGSMARPWLAPAQGRALYGDAELAQIARHAVDPVGATAQFAPTWQAWYRGSSGGQTPWRERAETPGSALAWQPVPAIMPWTTWAGSALAAQPVGVVWLARDVTLTAQQARQGGELALGIIDDTDMTFVNGRAIGTTFGWWPERRYRLNGAILRAGRNRILVAASNAWGTGGFSSDPATLALTLADGTRLPLATEWRYAVAPVSGLPPRAPWDNHAGVGLIHNAMIAPLGPFALRGVAWYQGESDVGLAGYDARLAGLIAGWRAQFGAAIDVLVVQLANFGPPATAPGNSDWAQLRAAQLRVAAADPHAALVSAIDLGDRTDIHPANKVELGRRLAAAAQALAGGQPSGPMPVAAVRAGPTVRVHFTGVTGSLVAWNAAGPIGFETCVATRCRNAAARIEGNAVVIDDPAGDATEVRYAWADSPVVNLYDAVPLPVPGFALPVTPAP